MARTRIKICGIRDQDSLAAAVEAGADAVGFVFVEGSPRAIDPGEADGLVSMLPPGGGGVYEGWDINVLEGM
jgi:phosphoribosylanthranilate isomerase